MMLKQWKNLKRRCSSRVVSRRSHVALRLAIVLVAMFCASCATITVREVRGLLLDVESREIVNADTITLRDDAGGVRIYRISAEVATDPDHPNTASHLRQHLLAGDPIVVHYRETIGGPVAIRIFDTSRSP